MAKPNEFYQKLMEHYPDTKYYLDFSNTLELMVAGILSPQVRDVVVNKRTPALFEKYKTAADYANADLDEMVELLQGITFAPRKANLIKSACQMLVEKHESKVPDTMEELTQLPGIGRKTANAILINGFDKIVGIPVDTHAIRLAQRLGFSGYKNPEKIEQDLMKLYPKEQWKKLPHLLKIHGQKICKPKPRCEKCFLSKMCPKKTVK